MSSPREDQEWGVTIRQDEILVRFDADASEAARNQALEAIGGRMKGPFDAGGHLARVSLAEGLAVEDAIAILSRQPAVKYAQPQYVMAASEDVDSWSEAPPPADTADASPAWFAADSLAELVTLFDGGAFRPADFLLA